ncbi:MAG: PQQ-dependent sugar dehydrogenase [Verrucomicrobiae bacterium]|nr:PQQ-dependent sugar dehydrogenase [Verrucomicrobiae bacterium]
MRVFARILFKTVVLFFLWAFIGASIYSIGSTLMARQTDKVALPAVPLLAAPIGEQVVEGNAVLVAKVTMDPVDLEFDAEATGFVLDEKGVIFRISPSGITDAVPWLILPNDQTEKSIPFRAMALHPGFRDMDSRGYGRVYTIEPEKAGTGIADFRPEFGAQTEHHQEVLCEYRTDDPKSRVFTGNRKVLARFSQPGPDNNVSDIVFDRLGRLFIGVGDGASGAPGKTATSRNAMSLLNAFGKVLRIDPLGDNSANGQYGIPPRNPFLIIDQALPEIWCYGLRDPQRLEYDPYRDWLAIVDRGLDGIEELNLSDTGGEHFGWDLCEGSFFYPPSRGRRPTDGVRAPIAEFARNGSDLATGGFIYRGELFPALRGRLLMSSSGGRILTSRISGDSSLARLMVGNQREVTEAGITGIRPGPTGELFILTKGGGIYELQKQTASAGSKKRRRPLLYWAL